MRRILSCLLLLAAVAQARSLRITHFHADLELTAEGRLDVVERLDVRFDGEWNGIFREIPYGYTFPSGLRGTIHLVVDGVEDGDGHPLEYWQSRERGFVRLKIRVPGASDAVRRVVIRYSAHDVVRRYGSADDSDFPVQDELYWNVTGHGWPFRIDRATATVRLPESLPAEAVVAEAYTGGYGAHGNRVETDGLKFETTAYLPSRHGLTVVVGFPAGYVSSPTWAQRRIWFLTVNWHLVIPILVLGLWILFWWWYGRDPADTGPVIAEYEPPDGLPPAEVGVLADERLHRRDVTAALVDLARRGYLKIEGTGDDYRLERMADWPEIGRLRPFENKLMHTVFKTSTVSLDDAGPSFHDGFDDMRRELMDSLVKEGYFAANPATVRLVWMIVNWAAVVLLFLFGLVFAPAPAYYFLVMIPCVIAMFFVGRFMARRTRKGREALRRIRGMEEYIRTAEVNRLQNLPEEKIEALLPHAIALDLVDKWTAVFARLFKEPPAWLAVDPQGFRWNRTLTDFVDRSDTSQGYAPRTSWSSGGSGRSWGGGWSGGSGFSGGGGGFSGGGFGGGGGGGW